MLQLHIFLVMVDLSPSRRNDSRSRHAKINWEQPLAQVNSGKLDGSKQAALVDADALICRRALTHGGSGFVAPYAKASPSPSCIYYSSVATRSTAASLLWPLQWRLRTQANGQRIVMVLLKVTRVSEKAVGC